MHAYEEKICHKLFINSFSDGAASVQLPVNYLIFKSAFHICFGATDQKHKTNLRFTYLYTYYTDTHKYIYIYTFIWYTQTASHLHIVVCTFPPLRVYVFYARFAISGRVTSSMGVLKFLANKCGWLSVKFRPS